MFHELLRRWTPFRRYEIERIFTEVAVDLKNVLVLDSIDAVPDLPGYVIHTHDLHGPLPDLAVTETGDRWEVLEALRLLCCRLAAMSRMRDDLAHYLPGSKFLPPTTLDGKAVVGMRVGPKTILEEGEDFIAAYHELKAAVTGG
jgi:hypothetical protein